MLSAILSLDDYIFNLVYHLPHPRAVTGLMIFFTILGSAGFIWVVISVYYAGKTSQPRMVIYHVAGLMSILFLTELVLKPCLRRLRPAVEAYVSPSVFLPGSFSFPSGHAASSFAMASFIGSLTSASPVYLYLLAGVISFSRVYLGVHFPLDVVVGALVGIIFGRIAGCFLTKLSRD